MEQKLKEFYTEFNSIYGGKLLSVVFNKGKNFFIKHLISSMLAVLEESNEIHKKYWFYIDQWHDAECSFIQCDKGVCNCDIEKNEMIINLLKEKV